MESCTITDACDKIMGMKLNSSQCGELITTVIDSLALTYLNEFVQFKNIKTKQIINYAIILNIAENGIKINLVKKLRYTGVPHILHRKYEKRVISAKVQKLLKKGLIKVCTHKP